MADVSVHRIVAIFTNTCPLGVPEGTIIRKLYFVDDEGQRLELTAFGADDTALRVQKVADPVGRAVTLSTQIKMAQVTP